MYTKILASYIMSTVYSKATDIRNCERCCSTCPSLYLAGVISLLPTEVCNMHYMYVAIVCMLILRTGM